MEMGPQLSKQHEEWKWEMANGEGERRRELNVGRAVLRNHRKWGISTVLECHFYRRNRSAEAKKATVHAELGLVAEWSRENPS